MMDVVVRAARLPRPGETVVGSSVATFVGGKGNNQAIAAARLGASVALIGKVGEDAFGAEIVAYAERSGVECSGVLRDPAQATGVAVPVVFDDGGNSIFAVPQANLALTAAEVERRASSIEQASALVLQFEVTMEATVAAAHIAHRAGVPVVLNTAPFSDPPGGLLALASVLVANETEASGLCARQADPLRQAVSLLDEGPGAVIVTLGEHGLVAAVRDGPTLVRPGFPVRAIDSVGAGDAFCGALAVALAEQLPLPDAIRFAQAAGALATTRPGAAASLPWRAEVEALLTANPGCG